MERIYALIVGAGGPGGSAGVVAALHLYAPGNQPADMPDATGNPQAVIGASWDGKAFTAPALPPVPAPVLSRAAFAIAAADAGLITKAEAVKLATGVAVPAMAKPAMQMMADLSWRFEIDMLTTDAVRRGDPEIALIQWANGLTDAAVDLLFRGDRP